MRATTAVAAMMALYARVLGYLTLDFVKAPVWISQQP